MPLQHRKTTAKLAKKLALKDIYNWIMTDGYFPESYVLPPCFEVEKYPAFGKIYFPATNNKYNPRSSLLTQIQFPKNDYADRTFGIIDPEIHCDIAYEISKNWKTLLKRIFNAQNKVYSYSFPIPLDSKQPGSIGRLRSGRMIYEFIEMAEDDVAAEAFQFDFLVKADIKIFYPSVYTHTLAWATHSPKFIRPKGRRNNFKFLGNRLDKLFRCANDEKSIGVPIGPVISDFATELLLSQVDTEFSRKSKDKVFLAVRFKDDYRILCESERDARALIKNLQEALKSYNLEISEGKTTVEHLPDGIFRPWVSRYHSVNSNPKNEYSYKQFKESYLSVIAIDRDLPGTGVVDRFLSDIITKDYKPNFVVSKKTTLKIISLLLMLADLRIKSFPRILGVIEAILRSQNTTWYTNQIGNHLANYLDSLANSEKDNRYLIVWILYFLKSNKLDKFLKRKYAFKDPIVKSVYSNRSNIYNKCKDFKLFKGISKSAKQKSLLEHLDVFAPQ